ncbi:histidine phosphatase family protein [Cyanobium sp. Morenito 9A2]|uniref:histidine phosphatase family protein n=1 Tax=Cyanobium sp. Morenito 9A2 TaxID=2823718 RepID=UPI0020CD0AF0|nr:histidine phosphatase family protein [Cyanobium sp. Morenito 9A2]MCP9849231.1 histidine phosphatase family protein [Cyanobium sp. Morenito 9A2]
MAAAQEPSPADAVLIRHGETAWSRSGRHTSTTDLPLTAHGEEAARRLVPVLAGMELAMVLSSPRQRALQTCRLAGLGARVQVDDDLAEWSYGDYEGLTAAEIELQQPGWLLFRDGAAGGESPAQVAARVDRVIARVRAARGPVALFAHGHVLRVFVARWIGLSAGQGQHFLLDTSTLSVLSHYRGLPAVKSWNAPQGA